jgi:pimeloyl-ACP methyl ester carboxylesterase
MTTTLIFVHGTFSSSATWSARFTSRLAELIGDDAKIRQLEWSGWNTVRDRLDGSEKFRKLAADLKREASSDLRIVICHSHGGSVVMGALAQEPQLPIDGVVCIGTPFIHVARPSEVLPGVRPPFKPVASVVAFLVVAAIAALLASPPGRLATRQLMHWLWTHPFLVLSFVLGALMIYVLFGLLLIVRAESTTTPYDVMTDEEQMAEWRKELLSEPVDDVWKLKQRCKLPVHERVPTLLIKMPGDEAHGALAAAQLASWMIRVMYGVPLRVLRKFRRDPEDVGLLGLPLFLFLILAGIIYRAVISLPIILLSAVALLPFGIEFSRLAGRILVAVGDAPPGEWRITYLAPLDRYEERLRSFAQFHDEAEIDRQLETIERDLDDQWKESTKRITHSRAHNDFRTANVVAEWWRGEREKLERVGEGAT